MNEWMKYIRKKHNPNNNETGKQFEREEKNSLFFCFLLFSLMREWVSECLERKAKEKEKKRIKNRDEGEDEMIWLDDENVEISMN